MGFGSDKVKNISNFFMEKKMNTQIAKGTMRELKGDLKQTWAKLTDDDINYLDGNVDEIIGKVQRAYGFTRERAHEEFDKFKRAHSNYFREEREFNKKENSMATPTSSFNNQLNSSVNNLKSRASNAYDDELSEPVNQYMDKAREFGSMALDRSTEFVRTYPGYTILGAASIGFLLGSYFSRRR